MNIEDDILKARFDDKKAFFASGATLDRKFRLRQLENSGCASSRRSRKPYARGRAASRTRWRATSASRYSSRT